MKEKKNKTKPNLKELFLKNLNWWLSGLITLLLSLIVWFYFSTPVSRFTFIMPIIATWIFYLIISETDDRD